MQILLKRRMSAIGMVSILTFANVGTPADQTETETITREREVVAELFVYREGLGEERAAAILVGKSAKRAYLVTAYHVVTTKRSGDKDVPVAHVSVKWHGRPEQMEGEVLGLHDVALDIAVVSVSADELPSPYTPTLIGDVAPSIPIRIVGHPNAGAWSIWDGQVTNENGSGGDIRHFSYSGAAPLQDGYSGGPIFDIDGRLVGIHSSSNPLYGNGTKATTLLQLLSAWNVPTSFSASQPLPTHAITRQERDEALKTIADELHADTVVVKKGITGRDPHWDIASQERAPRAAVGPIRITVHPISLAIWRRYRTFVPKSPPACDVAGFQDVRLPVSCLVFDDVLQFMESLNAWSGRTFRLPTAQEWHYAAVMKAIALDNYNRGYNWTFTCIASDADPCAARVGPEGGVDASGTLFVNDADLFPDIRPLASVSFRLVEVESQP
jgi:hypothetical protein